MAYGLARAAGLQQAAIERQRLQTAQSAFSQKNQFQGVIRKMQAAQEKANLLNEQRYQQALGQFENLGQAGRARIEQQTIQRQAEATQGLTSRGLGSTTITSAVERGIASDAELSRQQLDESVAVQKAGVIERRTDVGPDLGMFSNLLQAASQQQAPQRSVITRMGANAMQGLDVFGSPSRYFGPSTSSGTKRVRNKARFIPSRSSGLRR